MKWKWIRSESIGAMNDVGDIFEVLNVEDFFSDDEIEIDFPLL